MQKPKLGYWNFRGLAEPIRYLLHYKGVDFEDKRYTGGRESWLNEKFDLGLDFPNLPYFIDADVKLTQSTTILRYLARKHGLDGKNEEEKIRVGILEQQLCDFRMEFFMLGMDHDFEKLKPEYIKGLSDEARAFSRYLGDRKFLAGDTLTYVDFIAYDGIDFNRYLDPNFLDEFPNLKQYQLRLQNLPELQDYFKSDIYVTWPIMNPAAKFAGSGPEPERTPL